MRGITWISAFLFFWGCNNKTSTQQLLDANYLTSGQRPITLLSPANNTIISPSNLTFVWSNVQGVGEYDFQIASDQAFSQIILSKRVADNSYVFQTSDLIGITALDSAGYYWRVKVPYVANNLQSVTWVINSLAANTNGGSDFYVNINSTSSVQVGTKTNPYKSIFLAVKAADVFRSGNPAIPMRLLVAKGTYTEAITLYAGISMLGGYDPADWSRNITNNTTTISPLVDVSLTIGADVITAYTGTTIVEGFTFLSGSTANVPGTNGQVVLTNASPTIKNNSFAMPAAAVYVGIHFVGGSPVILGNSFNGNNAGTHGIYCNVSSGSFQINQNNFTGTQYSALADFVQCGGTFSGNNASPGFVQGYGIIASGVPAQPLSILSNSILIANSIGSGRGIYMDNNASPVIANNIVTIACSSSCSSSSPYITAVGMCAATPTITNNVLISGATGTTTMTLSQQCGTNGAPVATNNILVTTSGSTQTCHNISATPVNVENNYFVTCTGGGGTNYSTALFSTVNFAGGTTYAYGMDFHLTSGSPTTLRTSGVNTATSVCGTTSTLPCGNVTTDKDGAARTVPYSIGAYEY